MTALAIIFLVIVFLHLVTYAQYRSDNSADSAAALGFISMLGLLVGTALAIVALA